MEKKPTEKNDDPEDFSDLIEIEENSVLEYSMDELNTSQEKLIETIEIYPVCNEIIGILSEFSQNHESICRSIEKSEENSFLLWTLIGGILSLFEGTSFSLIKILSTNKSFIPQREINLSGRLIKKIKLKNSRERKCILDGISKSTLNNPIDVADILSEIFGITSLSDRAKKEKFNLRLIIEKRNDYTHRNGISKDGKKEETSIEDALCIAEAIDKITAEFMNEVRLNIEGKIG